MNNIFVPADILLPSSTADLEKWSVVACDQYTSEPKYWETAAEIVGDAPSTLNIIFPEVYLGCGDAGERIKKINAEMRRYLDNNFFKEYKNSFIYVERSQSDGKTRRGIVGALDLEAYDFTRGSQSPVRATEGTIIERIPPRCRIRENAPLELPHIMMLIDDIGKTVVEPLTEKRDFLEKLYDFELMLGGGHIRGYLCDGECNDSILNALSALANPDRFAEKYGDKGVLLFAAGDGNHSLATAKTCWEELKKSLTPEEVEVHPARYALVEIENIHDDALEFEPIQRVLFDVEPERLLSGLVEHYGASAENNGGQCIRYVFSAKDGGVKEGSIYIKNAPSNLPVGTLQLYLDKYLEQNGGRIDYIHGDNVVRKLTEEPGTIGFMVPKMEKSQLFETVIKDGALPRKTFSMGGAADKRYYLECKRI